ncbi:unnamed protein product [Closterium sp. NIES-53]
MPPKGKNKALPEASSLEATSSSLEAPSSSYAPASSDPVGEGKGKALEESVNVPVTEAPAIRTEAFNRVRYTKILLLFVALDLEVASIITTVRTLMRHIWSSTLSDGAVDSAKFQELLLALRNRRQSALKDGVCFHRNCIQSPELILMSSRVLAGPSQDLIFMGPPVTLPVMQHPCPSRAPSAWRFLPITRPGRVAVSARRTPQECGGFCPSHAPSAWRFLPVARPGRVAVSARRTPRACIGFCPSRAPSTRRCSARRSPPACDGFLPVTRGPRRSASRRPCRPLPPPSPALRAADWGGRRFLLGASCASAQRLVRLACSCPPHQIAHLAPPPFSALSLLHMQKFGGRGRWCKGEVAPTAPPCLLSFTAAPAAVGGRVEWWEWWERQEELLPLPLAFPSLSLLRVQQWGGGVASQHLTAMVQARKTSTQIAELQTATGVVSNPRDILHAASAFFADISGRDQCQLEEDWHPAQGKKLRFWEAEELAADWKEEEVKKAFSAMATNKSLGKDGLPKELFEAHQDLLGKGFMALAKDFASSAVLSTEVKEAGYSTASQERG